MCAVHSTRASCSRSHSPSVALPWLLRRCPVACSSGTYPKHLISLLQKASPREGEEEYAEKKALLENHFDQMLKLKDIVDGTKTLAFHLEPKTVVLRVSMHCNGCARKVQKHISKMEGVTSFEVDLENKKVVVMGDVTPFEVLESISKVKFAELWVAP